MTRPRMFADSFHRAAERAASGYPALEAATVP